MKALAAFNRNLDGQMIVGNPDHPDANGRFVFVTEESAVKLEGESLAERRPLIDPKEGEEEETDEDGQVMPRSPEDFAAGLSSAHQVREDNLTSGASTVGKAGRRNKPGPVGGSDTSATTNHPADSGPASSEGLSDEDEGLDAAPTGTETPAA